MFFAVALSLTMLFGLGGATTNMHESSSLNASLPSQQDVVDADALAKVDVFEVSGLIDAVVAQGIEQAVERSAANGAQALVLQVNSRGAVINEIRMREVLLAIRNSSIPVGVWVGPSGAQAQGWSAWLLAVADVSAMASNATVGRTGTPFLVGDETLSLGDATALLRNGTLGTNEAREQGVLRLEIADEGVPVLRNMLFALDGLTIKGKTLNTVIDVVGADGAVTRQAATTRFFKLGTLEQLMHTSASAALAYLLFAFGLALLIFEFFTAGVGIAGFVGAVSTLLGSFGLAELPVRPVSLTLLILAIIALAIDVQVGIPRVWTGAGMTLFVIASFTLYGPVQEETLRISWITLISGIASMALAFIVGMPSMVRTRFATPTIGREWLIGSEGVAATDIAPDGEVTVRGARWRARTNRATPILSGQPLRVTAIDGVTLDVEPLEGAARDYREMRTPRP